MGVGPDYYNYTIVGDGDMSLRRIRANLVFVMQKFALRHLVGFTLY